MLLYIVYLPNDQLNLPADSIWAICKSKCFCRFLEIL